ncbi:unnamed protein product [Chrysoparadoxa australica]
MTGEPCNGELTCPLGNGCIENAGNGEIESYGLDAASLAQCMDDCEVQCSLHDQKKSFAITSAVFGIWFVISMLNCVFTVKERSQLVGNSALAHATPIVPSLLNTLRNCAFTSLLPAWICDAIVNTIVASLMTFFVRYIVQPEFSEGCNDGVPLPSPDPSSSWTCNSTLVLGASVTMLLLAAFLSTPLWLFLASRFGKRNAWLTWSFVSAVTNLLFLFVTKGDVPGMLAMGFLNGIPIGAKFLADAILADIIDYDEFLTNQRNEATYTMFKSFLPKVCAIPAAAVPLAVLNAVGHVPPINGQIQKQGTSVRVYLYFVAVLCPSALSFLAFYLKSKFPFKTKTQTDMIGEGLGAHMKGEPAKDPLTGVEYSIMQVKDDEEAHVFNLDTFPEVPLEMLQTPGKKGFKELQRKSHKHFGISLGAVALMLVLSIVSFDLMEMESASFVPVLCIIFFGMSVTASAFFFMRKRTAEEMLINPPPPDVIVRAIEHQRQLREIQRKSKNLSQTRKADREKNIGTSYELYFGYVTLSSYKFGDRHFLKLHPHAHSRRNPLYRCLNRIDTLFDEPKLRSLLCPGDAEYIRRNETLPWAIRRDFLDLLETKSFGYREVIKLSVRNMLEALETDGEAGPERAEYFRAQIKGYLGLASSEASLESGFAYRLGCEVYVPQPVVGGMLDYLGLAYLTQGAAEANA